MHEVREAIVKILDNVTVADLCKRSEKLLSASSGKSNDYVI
jgi:DNA-binding IscR family transcriptional regulator